MASSTSGGQPIHGTRYTYVYWRCRCAPCKKANTDYIRELRAKPKNLGGSDA